MKKEHKHGEFGPGMCGNECMPGCLDPCLGRGDKRSEGSVAAEAIVRAEVVSGRADRFEGGHVNRDGGLGGLAADLGSRMAPGFGAGDGIQNSDVLGAKGSGVTKGIR